MRQPRVLGFALCILGSAGLARAAVTLTWPGGAPCNTTLQACITGASPGDTVEIATNGPIAENLTIPQSLTLHPAAGFVPVINGYLILNSTGAAADITVQGLIVNGFVRANPGTADLSVHILNNTVTLSSDFEVVINVVSGTSPPYGNVTAEIRGNAVSITGSGQSAQCGGIGVGLIFDSGTTSTSIIGNTVTATGCGQGEGIIAQNGPGEAMTADIIGNRVIAPNTGGGIEFRNEFETAGSTLAGRIINNLVTDQNGNAGFPGAIVVSADGTQPIDVDVINNTVTRNNRGLGMAGGGAITGTVANNIFANNTNSGLFIDSGQAVTNTNNLVFGNGSDSFTPGPGTLFDDPSFVSTSDFHLRPYSQAIGHGSNAQVPADITTDLDGLARIQQGTVDMGAYESGLAPLAPIPDLSLAGRLALAALIALAALVVLRRS